MFDTKIKDYGMENSVIRRVGNIFDLEEWRDVKDYEEFYQVSNTGSAYGYVWRRK